MSDERASEASNHWERWFVPGVYPMTLLQIVRERGKDPAAMLRRAGIESEEADIAKGGLMLGPHMRLVMLVADELGDATVGVEMGWRLPPTALGSLGYALLSSPTLRDALDTLQQYWHLVGQGMVITTNVHEDSAHLELRASLYITERIRVNALELAITSIYRGLVALAPQAEGATEVWFDFEAPSHADLVRRRLDAVQYEMLTTKLTMPAELLDTPLVMANPVGFQRAVEWCAQEERERGLVGRQLVVRVQGELRLGSEGYPSLVELARRSHMSPRTLRRHLEREGASYSSMLEAARRRDALRLLDNPALAVRDVAELLGYENPANFTRAFKRWTGRTPSKHRAVST